MRLVLASSALLIASCRAPLPDPGPRADGHASEVTVIAEPAPAADGRIKAVSRFHLTLPDGAALEDTLLVRGELSEYHLRKIRDRNLPGTLVARLVPVLSWDTPDESVVAPTSALVPAEHYSLAHPDRGLLAVLEIEADGAAPLTRIWPPKLPQGLGASAEFCLFCGAGVVDFGTSPTLVSFDPAGPAAWAMRELVPVLGSDFCVALVADSPVSSARPLLPPIEVFGRVLEPTLILAGDSPAPLPVSCGAAELQFGPGCIELEDDRAWVRGPDVPTLWRVSGGSLEALGAVPPAGRLTLRGLVPASLSTLTVSVRTSAGELFAGAISVTTGPPRPHVVINEVYADPLGAEPAQEWVELYNDGLAAAELGTLRLRDSGGETALPPYLLAPGEFAILAREDYVATPGADVVPPASTTILRVAALGKNGLSNSGEPLELVDPAGERLSWFPAVPKPKAGVSVARRRPDSRADDPTGFAHHAPPGSSPGAANLVSD